MDAAKLQHLGRQQLLEACQAREAIRSAQILLAHVLSCKVEFLMAHPEALVTDRQIWRYLNLIQLRRRHWPVAYLTKTKGFLDLDLYVNTDVLIPRPETETLAEWVLSNHPNVDSKKVLDMGTGSGALALSLKRARPPWSVLGVDVSPKALGVARLNGRRLKLDVAWQVSNLFEHVTGAFDILVANLPYVPSTQEATLQPEVRMREPKRALFAGEKGLDVIWPFLEESQQHAKPGASVYLEFDPSHAPWVENWAAEKGSWPCDIRRDLNGHRRFARIEFP